MYRSIHGRGFSDVHLCHDRTPTRKIVEEIKTALPYDKESHSLDVLVIAGDYWDKLMPNNHPDVYEAELGIYYILRWCKAHDVVLLMVDGTPLHDSSQCRKFIHINEEAQIGVEIHYHEDVVVEYISKLDMNVLFVPDRPRVSPEETLKAVKTQMELKGLEKVDMACMHGCFKYQLPILADDHKHDERAYLDLVNQLIIIGHIHQHNPYERIIPPGSFSRLNHGEEHPKGWVDFVMHPGGNNKVKFVQNKAATQYVTVDLANLSLEEAHEKILGVTESIPHESHIRLRAPAGHPLFSEKVTFNYKASFPWFHWTTKVDQEKSVITPKEELMQLQEEYVPLIINQMNIMEVVKEQMNNKGTDERLVSSALAYLETVL